MEYYIVNYSGQFGFIKPWTAIRDKETSSLQFLTPSIIEGIEKKLFPELLNQPGIHKIIRHKLSFVSQSNQQEVIQAKGWVIKENKPATKNKSVINRNVLLDPILKLAFATESDARIAATQHICLCRNEDILFPDSQIALISEDEFNRMHGYELRFGISENSFLVGYNRFDDNKPMYGWIECDGLNIYD